MGTSVDRLSRSSREARSREASVHSREASVDRVPRTRAQQDAATARLACPRENKSIDDFANSREASIDRIPRTRAMQEAASARLSSPRPVYRPVAAEAVMQDEAACESSSSPSASATRAASIAEDWALSRRKWPIEGTAGASRKAGP